MVWSHLAFPIFSCFTPSPLFTMLQEFCFLSTPQTHQTHCCFETSAYAFLLEGIVFQRSSLGWLVLTFISAQISAPYRLAFRTSLSKLPLHHSSQSLSSLLCWFIFYMAVTTIWNYLYLFICLLSIFFLVSEQRDMVFCLSGALRNQSGIWYQVQDQ